MLRNTSVRDNKHNIKSKDFLNNFKSINDPNSSFYQPDEDILFFEDRYLNGELNIMFDESSVPFSDQEVMNACKQIHNGKSSGPDYLINDLIFFKLGFTVVAF